MPALLGRLSIWLVLAVVVISHLYHCHRHCHVACSQTAYWQLSRPGIFVIPMGSHDYVHSARGRWRILGCWRAHGSLLIHAAPLNHVAAATPEAVPYALAQSYLHWGFLAWAILGSLTTIMLMHYHYDKGLPLAPRTLLYPVFKEKALSGPLLLSPMPCVLWLWWPVPWGQSAF